MELTPPSHRTTGGVRLLQALCVKFRAFCAAKGVPLSAPPFTLQYDTNIPKQAGLSGSSAIICAALKCLMDHYAVKDSLPKAELPGLILSAETELGITAGLQDRVIQVYEGMVYMVRTPVLRICLRIGRVGSAQDDRGCPLIDARGVRVAIGAGYGRVRGSGRTSRNGRVSSSPRTRPGARQDFEKGRMEARGYGEYVPLPLTHLPPLYIIYADNPGDSGKMHRSVRAELRATEVAPGCVSPSAARDRSGERERESAVGRAARYTAPSAWQRVERQRQSVELPTRSTEADPHRPPVPRSTVKQRWDAGDILVRTGMQVVASVGPRL
jgi:hypothetical protein